ncbi:hypothetical protein GCM10027051_22590 [Niabella terrae]
MDLLNPQNQNAYDTSAIKTYYSKNGTFYEVFEGNLDRPRMFSIYKHPDGRYRIGIGLNIEKTEEYPITLIKWSDTDTDTLKGAFYRTPSSILVTKVWFNGELKWEHDSYKEPFFKIIK